MFYNGELLTETKEEGSFQSRHVLGYGGAASEVDGEAGYHAYHLDEQNSTVYIIGGQRQVENAYAYDAFGNLRGQAGELLNRILYTGQQYDQEMGQYYLRARYYNPVVGRFTQEDVYRGDGLNLYAYCQNNPVIYYDPSGYNGQNCKEEGNGGDSTEDSDTKINVPEGYEKDFEELAEYRQEQGMPVAGSADDKHTAAKLIMVEDEQDYFGKNGHGKKEEDRSVFTVNPQTATHGEGDVFYQAKVDGATSSTAILITDRDACRACGVNGGIRSMAKQMDITDLTVVSPGGVINFNPQIKPSPNPFL